uniref:Uncharacterized protein n=1 Tax=Globodera rostochiensis TaxID=31243 RepID=A0A914H3W8_GLORO
MTDGTTATGSNLLLCRCDRRLTWHEGKENTRSGERNGREERKTKESDVLNKEDTVPCGVEKLPSTTTTQIRSRRRQLIDWTNRCKSWPPRVFVHLLSILHE